MWPGTISRWPPRPGGPKMRGPIAEAGGGLKNQILYSAMRFKGPRWALLPAPSLESFADSRPFLVASRGNLESRRTQGVGFRGAPGGSLPHILSECPAPGHHLCGTNPRRIVLTQGTWRLRRTVGPPSSGALSVGTVLRYSSAGRNARASTGTFESNNSSSFFEGIKCPH